MTWVNTFKDLSEDEKKALVQKAYDTGFQFEKEFFNCAQCTMGALMEVFGCVDDEVFASAYNLGAGLGRTGKGTCGALNAAAMIIGTIHGRSYEDFKSGKQFPHSNELSRKLLNDFIDIYGSCICSKVHEKIFDGKAFDLSKPEEFEAFEEAGGHRDKCTSVVGTVSKLFAQMVVDGEI